MYIVCKLHYIKNFILLFQLWKELIMEVVKEVDDIHKKQQQTQATPPDSDVTTQRSVQHLSFPFVQLAPSDMFLLTMQPLYSNITETDYDAQETIQGIYGTQSYMHAKQPTSTVAKSTTCFRKSSGRLLEAQTMGTSLQNIFKPVGGGVLDQ